MLIKNINKNKLKLFNIYIYFFLNAHKKFSVNQRKFTPKVLFIYFIFQ